MDDELRKRIAELEELIVRLANRIYLAHEVLANLAESRCDVGKQTADAVDYERCTQ